MIYAVVAVFNRKEFTLRFLEALDKQTVGKIQYVIVDDGSTDGTAETILQRWPDAQIVTGPGNWYWTRSMQKGVEHVFTVAQPGDYVLCANNDQYAEPNAVAALVAASKKYSNAQGDAIVGSISKEYNNPKKLFDSAYTLKWSTHTYTPVPLAEHGDYAGDIDVLTCRLTLLPIAALRAYNFNGELLPHYYGDYDLFLQLKKRGFRLVLSYDSVLYDVGGISGIESAGNRLTLKQLYKNMTSIRSHNNIKYTLRYYYHSAPKWYYKVKFTAMMFYYYLYLFTWAVIISTWKALRG